VNAPCDPEQFRVLERQRLAAIVAADEATLERLHAVDFVLCTPIGTVLNRRQYLGGLIDGTISYLRFEPVTPLEVICDTHLAVLKYQSKIEINVAGNPPGHLVCWHLDVYELNKSWQCRWSQATESTSVG
jgi:hypothetical protein